MTSSLVIQTSFIGDTILTTPLISELARRGPVDVVTTPASAELLANNPGIRATIPYDKRGADRGIRGFARMARRLRGFPYDAAFLAQGSLRSAALALAAGVRQRIGLDTSAGRHLYTRRVEYREDMHHAARLLRLAMPDAEPTPQEYRPRLYPGVSERAAVDRLLASHPDQSGHPLVALAPGSVWATKRWPYYADLARALAPRARLLIAGSLEDRELAEGVRRAADGRALNCAGSLTLLGSAELIRRCAALVTNDSAPQHLASATDTPTITIFGPTVPAFGFGPLAARSMTSGVETLACRPCDRHGPRRCPLGHWRCMRDLPARDVAAAVLDILCVT